MPNRNVIMRVTIAILLILPLALGLLYITSPGKRTAPDPMLSRLQEPYLSFMNIVYERMKQDYYKDVSPKDYENFIKSYRKSHLSDPEALVEGAGHLAHLGSSMMVEELRAPEDTFTTFILPEDADKHPEAMHIKEYGLGIDGEISRDVFLITDVRPGSDAIQEGIVPGNVVMAINGRGVDTMTREEIEEFLAPPYGTEVDVVVAIVEERRLQDYTLKSREFFTEAIEEIPTGTPGVVYFKINSFEPETAGSLREIIEGYGPENIMYMVLDVTGSGYGPPPAARDLCSLFLPAETQLVYYMSKGQPQFGLVTPPGEILYAGRLLVLVDGDTSGAAEILAGTLQAHRRAFVMGTENTAGSAGLNRTIRFDDGSMMALVTAEAFLFDGTAIGKDGISPDFIIPEEVPDTRAFVLQQIMLSMQS